ncbi:MAG TPA: SIR2 family protein [Anaerolineales bacterium]|nr:SIR2 family protein [Anaerolineales bacterium]
MNVNENSTGIIRSLDYLMPFIESGRVIPFISNSLRIEEIFRDDKRLSNLIAQTHQFYDEVHTFDQQLTKIWASKIEYPMSDDHNIARVAQYRQITKGFSEGARKEYIEFLIDHLLEINENNDNYKDDVASIKSSTRIPRFSEVVSRLGYPRFQDGVKDPLRLLASLPLKIYVTTSYSDFLERALKAEGKNPRTQICFCKTKTGIDSAHLPDRNFVPTEQGPAVIHLFGLEDYTNTLVLSEDDHINFLMNVAEEAGSMDMYPSYLRENLPGAGLLLLGYHLQDWEFRTLIRFISKIRKKESMDDAIPSIAIQFKPNLGQEQVEEHSINYMVRLFKKLEFKIKWAESENFIYDLFDAWSNYHGGQL